MRLSVNLTKMTKSRRRWVLHNLANTIARSVWSTLYLLQGVFGEWPQIDER